MWNIIRSQIYQMTRDVFTVCALFGVGLLYAVFTFSEMSQINELNGGMAFVTAGECFVIFLLIVVVLFPSRICGWDFNDRTINYEVLSGHKKSEIYFGRLLISVGVVLLLSALMLGIPVLIGILKGGWGPNLSGGAALRRCLMAVLVIIRFAAESSCMAFLLRNAYANMLVFYVLPEVFMMPILLTESTQLSFLSGMMSLMMLFEFNNTRSGFADGRDVMVYVTDMDPFTAASIPAAAVVVTVLCIVIGYAALKKRDMR